MWPTETFTAARRLVVAIVVANFVELEKAIRHHVTPFALGLKDDTVKSVYCGGSSVHPRKMIYHHTTRFNNMGWRDLEAGDDGVVSFAFHVLNLGDLIQDGEKHAEGVGAEETFRRMVLKLFPWLSDNNIEICGLSVTAALDGSCWFYVCIARRAARCYPRDLRAAAIKNGEYVVDEARSAACGAKWTSEEVDSLVATLDSVDTPETKAAGFLIVSSSYQPAEGRERRSLGACVEFVRSNRATLEEELGPGHWAFATRAEMKKPRLELMQRGWSAEACAELDDFDALARAADARRPEKGAAWVAARKVAGKSPWCNRTCFDALPGLGATKAERLLENGVDSVEKLAGIDLSDEDLMFRVTGNKRYGRASATVKKWRDAAETFLARGAAAVVEPDDDGYCVCGGGGDGEWVGCSNMDCTNGGGWFHLGCVGLDALPEGEWYCDACSPSPRACYLESVGLCGQGETHALDAFHVLGRSSLNDAIVGEKLPLGVGTDETGISRRQCTLERRGDGAYVATTAPSAFNPTGIILAGTERALVAPGASRALELDDVVVLDAFNEATTDESDVALIRFAYALRASPSMDCDAMAFAGAPSSGTAKRPRDGDGDVSPPKEASPLAPAPAIDDPAPKSCAPRPKKRKTVGKDEGRRAGHAILDAFRAGDHAKARELCAGRRLCFTATSAEFHDDTIIAKSSQIFVVKFLLNAAWKTDWSGSVDLLVASPGAEKKLTKKFQGAKKADVAIMSYDEFKTLGDAAGGLLKAAELATAAINAVAVAHEAPVRYQDLANAKDVVVTGCSPEISAALREAGATTRGKATPSTTLLVRADGVDARARGAFADITNGFTHNEAGAKSRGAAVISGATVVAMLKAGGFLPESFAKAC